MNTASTPLEAYASFETLQTQVTEVSLIISVTDHKGHFIGGLAQNDFTIFDNFRRQASITFFENQTNLPLDIALVVDVSSSMAARFDTERSAIDDFLAETIRPGDSGRFFAFNQTIKGTLPIAYKRCKLSPSLKHIHPDGDTALYDAVYSAAQWLVQDSRLTRRIMVVISDGEENVSRTTPEATVMSLLNSGTVLYAVNAGNDYDTKIGRRGVAILRHLSDATGGSYFQLGGDGTVDSAFSKIRRELRSQYAVAYEPSDLSAERFHSVKVLVRNLTVHCRTGYYAK